MYIEELPYTFIFGPYTSNKNIHYVKYNLFTEQ